MKNNKRKAQPAPRWREFLLAAVKNSGRATLNLEHPEKDFIETISATIVRQGEGEAFLKAVRRGRSTQRQNLRYQLLREVERLMGDRVPRRRPDANTPDSVALRAPLVLKLE